MCEATGDDDVRTSEKPHIDEYLPESGTKIYGDDNFLHVLTGWGREPYVPQSKSESVKTHLVPRATLGCNLMNAFASPSAAPLGRHVQQ